MKTEFRKGDFLRMIVVFRWMDQIERLDASAELSRQREDIGKDLRLAFFWRGGLRRVVGHCGVIR